jgi:hypothetical protein
MQLACSLAALSSIAIETRHLARNGGTEVFRVGNLNDC